MPLLFFFVVVASSPSDDDGYSLHTRPWGRAGKGLDDLEFLSALLVPSVMCILTTFIVIWGIWIHYYYKFLIAYWCKNYKFILQIWGNILKLYLKFVRLRCVNALMWCEWVCFYIWISFSLKVVPPIIFWLCHCIVVVSWWSASHGQRHQGDNRCVRLAVADGWCCFVMTEQYCWFADSRLLVLI